MSKQELQEKAELYVVNKKRFEEIKRAHEWRKKNLQGGIYSLLSEDIDWLINRVEELEEKFGICQSMEFYVVKRRENNESGQTV